MPDDTSTADTTTDDTSHDGPPDTGDTTDWRAESEKWKALAQKHEGRAKSNATAAKELEDLRKQAMTDQERAVAEAKAVGRAEALVEVGAQLVDAEIRAHSAGRLEDGQLSTLLQGINRAAFLSEDGTVDQASVKRFVDGIAPKPNPQQNPAFPDLGQGARGGGDAALNGDPLLKDLKAHLGIR